MTIPSPLIYGEITNDKFNRYWSGIQQTARTDSFGKYADKIGSGFVYLLFNQSTNPVINFHISRNGKKMYYKIPCVKKLIVRILN